ncbi:MAG TPA: MlaD family protein [Jatrophihabitans sp.]|jgi:phospholipid/cholesterol/gamma-HCH transport system substrate-binding protein
MITRRVRTQVLVFVVIGMVAVSYIAVRYVGLLRVFGVGVYGVQVDLPAAGGIFPNAEVDYRGVPVGRVTAVRLTADGVAADLQLNTSAPSIPQDLHAVVTDRSVIGEQFLDLRPNTNSGPYLHDGSVIPRSQTAIPPTTNSLLTSVNGLLQTLPIHSLQTVVRESGTAFAGSAQNLRTLIQVSRSFFRTADRNFPATTILIDSSTTVLATQRRVSSSIRSFSRSLNLLSGRLAASDSDVRALLRTTPSAARAASDLIRSIGTPLGVLVSNLTTTAQVTVANVDGVRQLLVQLPRAVDIGSTVVGPQGAKVGLTLTFFNPLPCTQGYEGTVRRSGLNTSAGAPLNTSAGCTATSGANDVRGSQHVPFPAGVTSTADARSVHSLAQLMGS